MSSSLSRVMSGATAVYAGYALVRPRHLGAALSDVPQHQQGYDLLATTYGWRDLAISAVGVLAPSASAVRAAMLVRIALDVADARVLTGQAEAVPARNKVAAATLGWASLNLTAVVVDARRDTKVRRGGVRTGNLAGRPR